jgi:hypothetical protein
MQDAGCGMQDAGFTGEDILLLNERIRVERVKRIYLFNII